MKLDLMGAEPTLRPDLEEIISYAHKGGHLTALHTNGLRFSEPGYLDKLVNAGLDEVHLQMDGFSGRFDMALRGRSMDKPREKALAELKRLDVATDLVAVIMRDGNEDEMGDILDYAAKNSFVKEIFTSACVCWAGRRRSLKRRASCRTN
ncbi:MAG: radical SAM protein [Deltaproteobacteria bacterium]|nr:radical SAM protein [Deltaproteobacteria bacterium]